MVNIEVRNTTQMERESVLSDYRLAVQSREASLIGRREVLTGKAKFGIFGDGKEVAQLAMAKVFKPGDFRAGYYRDQTFMFATGEHTIAEYFAQLYADADVVREPAGAGRLMNAHFSTRSLDAQGAWKDLMAIKNSSADVSPTASQMPRLVGLAYASKLYRELDALKEFTTFSHDGSEIAFGTIGNASAAEGIFWEAVDAIGVLQSPAILSIWDDDYGISVSNRRQHTRDLSDLLSGFSRKDGGGGYNVYRVAGWDYAELLDVYGDAEAHARKEHIPAIIHVVELTQPQGHSTSGSHERYKSAERLAWEQEHDCNVQFRTWIIETGLAEEEELAAIDKQARQEVEEIRTLAWEAFKQPVFEERDQLVDLLTRLEGEVVNGDEIAGLRKKMVSNQNLLYKDLVEMASKAIFETRSHQSPTQEALLAYKRRLEKAGQEKYSRHLHDENYKPGQIKGEQIPAYSAKSRTLNGFEILNKAFDSILARDPRVVAFGEDLGKIGGVNQGFAGLQAKYGELRVSDTGIREATIIGQAIGLAMRGLRPIAEIQYLDYMLYALQIMSDDLATVRWRTAGGQKAPVIVRTRGHRLEGIWHSGSPLGGLVHFLRGMYIAVPRNMVQAAGFYNTLLQLDDPGLVIEVLNGYRQKEKLPDNLATYTVPLGQPDILHEGDDVTLVTYGAMCRVVMEAVERLDAVGISAEVIDVQTLLPFDVNGVILESLKKTSRIIFMDEDVPGGTTAYMLQKVIEEQGGYYWLDSEPRTLTSAVHRPAYGSDGNYFSKPNVESVFETTYRLMHEVSPVQYPLFF